MAKTDAGKLWRRRNREYIQACKVLSSCKQCGENRPICLDYHHKDPDNKLFGLAEDGERHSVDAIDAEMRKCVVLCANCHRIVSAEQRRDRLANATEEELKTLFDEAGG